MAQITKEIIEKIQSSKQLRKCCRDVFRSNFDRWIREEVSGKTSQLQLPEKLIQLKSILSEFGFNLSSIDDMVSACESKVESEIAA